MKKTGSLWCPGRDLNPHSPCGEKDFKTLLELKSGTNLLLFQAFKTQQARRRYREYRSRTAQILHTHFFTQLATRVLDGARSDFANRAARYLTAILSSTSR